MSDTAQVFPDWLKSRVDASPDRIALIAEERSWTFAALDAEVTSTAQKLATLGVVAGDRIATLLHNGFVAAILPHAALRLGATLVPLNARLSEAEIAWQLSDAAPRLLIVEKRTFQGGAKVREENPSLTVARIDADGASLPGIPSLAEVNGRDVSLRLEHDAATVLAVIYTSGTTGRPKGAMLTVSNFWWSALGSALNLDNREDDRWLVCLPLFHVGGLSILMRSVIYGIAAVVQDGFDADAVNSAIDNDEVTLVSVVAVMLQRILDARSGRPFPPTLRCVLLGGGPAPKPLLDRCASIGTPVIQTYGLTESCSQVVTLAPEDTLRKLGSAGKPLYPNELRIVSTDGSGAQAEEPGEILVRGPVVMAGYFGNPEATATAITDGWLHTGDIGRVDAEGYLYVLDRRDDLIVTGGENVYPAEVEAVLLSHPAIVEAAVIGVEDQVWGQRVVAVARLANDSDIDADELKEFCRAKLAGYKVPREFRFVVEPLPRTASGKLRRSELRESTVTP